MKRYLCSFTIILVIIILGLYKLGIALYDYKGKVEGNFEATIYDIGKKTKYMQTYVITNKDGKFLAYIKKSELKLKIGDKINFQAEYSKPTEKRNEGGFDYSLYLKTKKISGIFKIEKINKVSKNKSIIYEWKNFIFNVKQSIKESAEKNLKKENSALLMGILLGETNELSNETLENFRKSSLTHVLAISGSNFAYIILILSYTNKISKRKRLSQIITIICILFFMELTGNTASVIRAGVMAILMIIASITHRKYDLWTSLAVATLLQIIYNPYCIFDLGLILSYGGVIGLVLFYNKLEKIIKIKIIRATICANILIIPILMYNFNTLSLSFIISNILTSFLVEVITIIGVLSIFIKFKIIFIILEISLTILNWIVNICAQIPFSQIYVNTPSLISILLYYAVLFLLLKKTRRKKLLAILTSLIIIFNINFTIIKISINNEVLINIIDVGQGDCTLIRKNDKTILIDGGGSSDDNYEIGKNVLIPGLLYKKINNIDQIIISHFDTDHVRRNNNSNGKFKSKRSNNLQSKN